MSRPEKPDCPDCGTEGGAIKTIAGVASLGKARISFITCLNCGGYWHRKTGEDFKYLQFGKPDWDAAAETILKLRTAA